MKALVYLALAVGAALLFVSSWRKRSSGVDRNVDLIAYAVMFAGCLFLFATCVSEELTGAPLF